MTRSVPLLIEAFLEMIAAERGATKNTLDAYARDLADYAAGLARAGKAPQNAATGDIRAYFSIGCGTRSQTRVERKETFLDPSVPPVSRCRPAPRR